MNTISPEARKLIGEHKLAAILDTYLATSPTKRARTPDLVKSSDLPKKWREFLSKQTPEAVRFFELLLDIKNRYTFLSRLIEAKLMKSLEASLLGLHKRPPLDPEIVDVSTNGDVGCHQPTPVQYRAFLKWRYRACHHRDGLITRGLLGHRLPVEVMHQAMLHRA